MTTKSEQNTADTGQAGGWLTRGLALALVLLAATALGVYVCYRLMRPFLPALAWALALAVVANPLYEWLRKRIPSVNLAAGLAVVVVAVIIIAPAIFVTQRLVREAVEGAQSIVVEVESGRWRETVAESPRLEEAISWAESQINFDEELRGLSSSVTALLSTYVTGSIWAVVQLLVTLFALFYFFRDRAAVLRKMRSLVPLSDAETDEVFTRIGETIYATVYGTLVVSAVQGLLGGLMFWWLGLRAPLLWGVVMGVLSVIPMLGAFVVWAPAALFLLLEGSWGKALILIAWGTAVVGLMDNLLYPALVGRRLRLHTLPVFIAVVGGILLFGASGLILGPVALAITAALFDVWRRRTAGGRAADTEPR